MTDHLTIDRRSDNMSRIKSKNTKPELIVRKALHGKGYRYKLHVKTLQGCPDIVLSRYKTIVEIRGCFWHGHNCSRGNRPKSNTLYWENKIKTNINRDKRNTLILKSAGWNIITIWECECSTEKKLVKSIKKIEKTCRLSSK